MATIVQIKDTENIVCWLHKEQSMACYADNNKDGKFDTRDTYEFTPAQEAVVHKHMTIDVDNRPLLKDEIDIANRELSRARNVWNEFSKEAGSGAKRLIEFSPIICNCQYAFRDIFVGLFRHDDKQKRSPDKKSHVDTISLDVEGLRVYVSDRSMLGPIRYVLDGLFWSTFSQRNKLR